LKRNESILVYSVTGLLVVILLVAILFGNEQAARAGEASRTAKMTLEELDEVADGSSADDASTRNPMSGPSAPAAGAGDAPVGTAAAGTPPEGVAPLVTKSTDAAGGAEPPAKAESEAAVDPALQVLALFGQSRRDGSYRVVTARGGDSFSSLVHRWCAGLDRMEEAEKLNEDVDLRAIKANQQLWLPWVDDAVVLEAHQRRQKTSVKETAVVERARSDSLTYVVRDGDKLWDIAVRQVGVGKAHDFIKRVQALNPEILRDPDRIRAGKTILLPR
jgi:nucleoid-associated protein YgaU